MKKSRSGETTKLAKSAKKSVVVKKTAAAKPLANPTETTSLKAGRRTSKKTESPNQPLTPTSVEPLRSAVTEPAKNETVAPEASLRDKTLGARKKVTPTQPTQQTAPARTSPPAKAPEPVPSVPASKAKTTASPAQAKSKRARALPRPARQPRKVLPKTFVAPATLDQSSPPPAETKVKTLAEIEKPLAEVQSEPPRPPTPLVLSLKIPPILLEGDEPSKPPLSGPGQKYSVGPKPPAEPLGPEEGELPEAYGTGRLLLTARDPHWLYVHWDLTGEQQRRYNARSLHHHLVVRVYREGANAQPLSESHAHPESRHWFIHVPYGGTRYVAELGYYERERLWFRVSTSDCVSTPPDLVTENKTVQFATIRFDLPPQRQSGPVIPQAEAVASPQGQNSGRVAPGIPETLRTIALPPIERFAVITGEIRQTEMPLAEMFRQGLPAAHQAPLTKELTWTAAQERALSELLTITETRQEWLGSIAITELIQRQSRLEAPAPELGLPELAPSSPFGGELEVELESVTSPAGGEEAKGKSFWFNVNAELVIYGATEPDAEVTIGGRRIRLRRDGSFSYRFSLPDGDYELPIVATATHGDSRRAILQFKRHTQYQGDVRKHPQDQSLNPPAPENL